MNTIIINKNTEKYYVKTNKIRSFPDIYAILMTSVPGVSESLSISRLKSYWNSQYCLITLQFIMEYQTPLVESPPSAQEKALGGEKIGRLLLKLSLPATVAMLANAFYNIVDTIFIGRGIGTGGIAGLAITLPIQMIVLSISLLIGIGAASMMSRSLGARDYQRAGYVTGNSTLCIVLLSLVVSIPGFILAREIVQIFGATDTILPYALPYSRIMFIGSCYFPFTVVANNLIRAEGNAKHAMISMIIGFGVNIILDYILIFPLQMGMRGAALATITGKFSTLIYIIFYFKSGRTTIKFALPFFKPVGRVIREMVALGLSAFTLHAGGGMVVVILNNLLARYGGDMGVALYGIIYKLILFLLMPIVGIKQGMQPVVGFNYGAGKYRRVGETIKKSILSSVILASLGTLVIEIFPGFILGIFSSDRELISAGTDVLRIAMSAVWLVGIHTTGLGVFQALGEAKPAFLLSILRRVLIFCPLILLLPRLVDPPIYGIWISFPLADLSAVVITVILLVMRTGKLNSASPRR